jgi:choline dehydrogenase-like flavoprotein
VIVDLVRASVPPGSVLKVDVDRDHMVEQVGLTLASMPWVERTGVRFLFWSFELGSAIFKGTRFTRMSLELQQSWLVRLAESQTSVVRLVARLILTVVKPAHFSHKKVQEQVRYPSDRLNDVVPSNRLSVPRERVFDGLERDTEVRCQVAVIGSGAGGGVIAAELAERGIDVVIIEAGRWFEHDELGRDPTDVLRKVYEDGGTTLAWGRPSIPIPLGKSVGGSTTINSGTCFRTPDPVLDRWAKNGLHIDRGHLDACYSKVEERINVQSVPEELLGGSSRVVARGAEAMGLEHGPLSRNIRGCKQSGVCAFGCPRNAKQSTNITYVPWALEAGARLFTGVRATELLRSGGRAAGVHGRDQNGRRLTVRADVVVSSCGTITGVPLLRKMGIRSSHLGRNLTIHPCAKIVAQMPEVVNGWEDTPQGYGLSGFQGEGLMFEGAFVPPEYTSIAMPFVGRAFTDVMEAYPHLAMFGFMVADQPSGRVFTGPHGRPLIRYMLHKKDQALIRRGLQILAELFFVAGAERIFLPIAGMEEQQTLSAALEALSGPINPMALELAAFHPLGTARMSSTRRKGVVDPDLESWEIPGLYVVDGSVVPTAIGVNPQVTIMALATRAAETIAARLA